MEANILKSIENKNLEIKLDSSLELKPLLIQNIDNDNDNNNYKNKLLNWFF